MLKVPELPGMVCAVDQFVPSLDCCNIRLALVVIVAAVIAARPLLPPAMETCKSPTSKRVPA